MYQVITLEIEDETAKSDAIYMELESISDGFEEEV